MRALMLVLAGAALLTGCAASAPGTNQPASPIPAYITAPQGCAIVAGGSLGSSFEDPRVSGFWNQVNEQISAALFEHLQGDGYRVVKLIVLPTDKVEQVIPRAMAANRCSRIIQVTHVVNEDARGKFFQFNVEVMHIKPSGSRAPGAQETRVVTVGEFARDYRYPRTPAVMQTFRTGTFASSVYRELAASGVLAPLKP